MQNRRDKWIHNFCMRVVRSLIKYENDTVFLLAPRRRLLRDGASASLTRYIARARSLPCLSLGVAL